MKKSDALALLNNMVVILQKSRSIVTEGGIDEKFAEYFNLNPFIFGKKCPLDTLLRVIESENVEPLFIYNMCVIFKRLEPILDVEASILGYEIPEPETSLLMPFES